jgi:hypothetical protein
MNEEEISPAIDLQTLHPEQATQLLQRQERLQVEARTVVAELGLVELLTSVGTLRQVGSSTLGLMVWRDIDLAVSSPGLSSAQAFETMRPLLIHPRIMQVRYFNQSGPFSLAGLEERYYFAVVYSPEVGIEWKMDISFWLEHELHPETVHDVLMQQLTDETRLAILWIKTAWYRLPAYRTTVYSTDIYDAVLQHGVRTPAAFDAYLAEHGKPTYAQAQGSNP